MEVSEMPKAAIFDLDGTLLDSVDLHALAWHEAMVKFGHGVSFEQARSQIGKGGDKLIPEFMSAEDQKDHGKELKLGTTSASRRRTCRWCDPSPRCPLCCCASAMRAYASPSVRRPRRMDELDKYLEIARIADLIHVKTSSDDADESKPAPDIFEVVLKKLGIAGDDAVAIGDTPDDASAAGKAGIATIGVLCGGFTEDSLRRAGCVDVYPGPAALFARFEDSGLAK
jgi:beta-phosphoglucomutase-like phosphatase (HAD superfamily)